MKPRAARAAARSASVSSGLREEEGVHRDLREGGPPPRHAATERPRRWATRSRSAVSSAKRAEGTASRIAPEAAERGGDGLGRRRARRRSRRGARRRLRARARQAATSSREKGGRGEASPVPERPSSSTSCDEEVGPAGAAAREAEGGDPHAAPMPRGRGCGHSTPVRPGNPG